MYQIKRLMILCALGSALLCEAQNGSPIVPKGQIVPTYVVQITRFGINPNVINAKAGPILLIIHNRTPIDSLSFNTFKLDAGKVPAGALSLLDVLFDAKKADFSILTSVQAGSYSLSDKRFPEWSLQLNVAP